jgi:hypothetical protein
MMDIILLILKIAGLVLLYLFIWLIVRATTRDVYSAGGVAAAPDIAMPEAPPPPVASPAERAQRRQERVTERTLAGEALDLTVNIDPRLIVERSPVAPTGVVFPLSGPVTVGRAPTSDITLDETFVSQTHARLILRGQFYFVEDLGSTNGTFVNEKEVSEAQLKPDSRLRIGETVFRYEE